MTCLSVTGGSVGVHIQATTTGVQKQQANSSKKPITGKCVGCGKPTPETTRGRQISPQKRQIYDSTANFTISSKETV
jgi:hypothetical protein